MQVSGRFKSCWSVGLVTVIAALLGGCEALYQSYDFSERIPSVMPLRVDPEDVWVTSIPEGAEIYVQPYEPDVIPSHDTDPAAFRGKTPLSLTLPPGSYWIELAFDAEVFDLFFDPPYDDVQFEPAGATYEALLFQPLTPGAKRRVLRYYRVDKQAGQGQTLVALFHPRSQPAERVAALYPQSEQFDLSADEINGLLQQLDVPPAAREQLLSLLQRGGKVLWNRSEGTYKVAPRSGSGRNPGPHRGPLYRCPPAGPTPAGRRRLLGILQGRARAANSRSG